AVLNALTLVLAGHPWVITWAFALWGAKLVALLGYDLSTVPFWSGDFQRAAVAAPVLADVTSVMDLGLVLGACLGAGLAGRFAPAGRVRLRLAAASLLGGLLLGYGSRIAFGCNIGAYVSGIASTSLHGWLWGAAALLGTPVGVWLRRLVGVGDRRRRALDDRQPALAPARHRDRPRQGERGVLLQCRARDGRPHDPLRRGPDPDRGGRGRLRQRRAARQGRHQRREPPPVSRRSEQHGAGAVVLPARGGARTPPRDEVPVPAPDPSHQHQVARTIVLS